MPFRNIKNIAIGNQQISKLPTIIAIVFAIWISSSLTFCSAVSDSAATSSVLFLSWKKNFELFSYLKEPTDYSLTRIWRICFRKFRIQTLVENFRKIPWKSSVWLVESRFFFHNFTKELKRWFMPNERLDW